MAKFIRSKMKYLFTSALLLISFISFSQNQHKETGETFIKLLLQEKNYEQTSFISYPNLNYLFMGGENRSEPKEYMIKGNVDEMVVNDIFIFIEKK